MRKKLPRGWIQTTLAEICRPVSPLNPADFPGEKFTYFDIGSIDNKLNRISEPKIVTSRTAPSRARQAVRKADILFSTVRTYLKKIAMIEEDYPNPVASTGFTVIRPAVGVSSRYLFFQVLTDPFLQPLHELQTGTSYPAVRDRDVLSQPILLAPTREQHRIVEKLDAALSSVIRAEAASNRALGRLQHYREAVLDAAVTGKLTRSWREERLHSESETENADELLSRILTGRRRQWEKAKLQRLRSHKERGNERWKDRYPEASPPKLEKAPDIPRTWVWASVEQLSAHEERSITDGPFGSNLKTAHYTGSGPRVVRLQNIGDGYFIDEKAHISRKHYESLKKYAVRAGDLVIRALGTPAPRACRIPKWLGPAIVKADCVRFKVASRFVSPDYVMWSLNSPTVQSLTEQMIHGIGRPRLNLREIKSIPVPLPPFEEQLEIVRHLKSRLNASARLAKKLDRQLGRAGATRELLMEQAFSGKLVPQALEDEPASLLLEKIKIAHRTEVEEVKRRRMPRAKVSAPSRRSLIEVLNQHSKPITPEALFTEAGFEPEQVDLFYRELATLRDQLTEQRPRQPQSRNWPGQPAVTLQLKGRKK